MPSKSKPAQKAAKIPTGPVERTIEYTAPFTRCNREQDYALVWRALDEEASKEV